MNRRHVPLVLALTAFACACGGGGGGGVVNPNPSPIAASFVPAEPSPAASTVSMNTGGATNDLAVVRVNVTGTDNVWGAAFDVQFDSVNVEYAGYSAGDLFGTGSTVNYTVRQPTGSSGLVVVGVSRVGSAPAVNVTTTKTLVNLLFRVKSKGEYALSFAPGASLLDASVTSIAGLVEPWPAGSLQGN